ncbi:MAG: aminomethyl-transferring glycine dehydrogenase subunit GcvPA [Planctomycetaceae bacterium]|nr:aminomethyl-transferring glycine dehydrogenase subunit GcvPA [Planctomycetaceae bacterium]
MNYLLQTPEQQQTMLQKIGVPSIETLLEQIPAELRLDRPLELPPALGELELDGELRQAAARTVGASSRVCFLGGGAYEHFIPAAVDELSGRGEFYTAYTPYQAEASQGTLQAFYEFQTLICQLTGMEVANASLYEGGTAVTEAAFMAMRVTGRTGPVIIPGGVHPQYQTVCRTYLESQDLSVVQTSLREGVTDLAALRSAITPATSCVVIQQPNALGMVEDIDAIREVVHASGALLVVVCDPISLGILKRPGDQGADIVVAEGQSLGIPLQFGGPYLGLLACRNDYVRKMPGRLIGKTQDRNGKSCYVLNLQTREQHIRRDKATSNICTNQGLMALRATIYLSLLGPHGLAELAELCCRRAHYLAQELARRTDVKVLSPKGFFKEFVIRHPQGGEFLKQKARAAGFDIGPTLEEFGDLPGVDPALRKEGVLVAVTECRTPEDLDGLVNALSN